MRLDEAAPRLAPFGHSLRRHALHVGRLVQKDEQARARVGEKGRDAARVAVEMANLVLALEEDGAAAGADDE